jgi:hypothetical protein
VTATSETSKRCEQLTNVLSVEPHIKLGRIGIVVFVVEQLPNLFLGRV